MMFRRPEHRILFLCTANVCRSPLAEALLRHRLRERGQASRVMVASAGTRVGQPGRRPDPRVAKLCAEAGVSLRGIRARPVNARILERNDTILIMEQRHCDDLLADGLTDQLDDRVQFLGKFLPPGVSTDENYAIPDPYFADREGFRQVYAQIDAAVLGFVDDLF